MRFPILFPALGLSLLLTVPALAQTAAVAAGGERTILPSDYLLHMPFNEEAGQVAYDVATWRQPVPIAASTSWSEGVIDGALAFDGSGYMEIPGALVDASGAGTYALWVRSTGVAGLDYQYILAESVGGSNPAYALLLDWVTGFVAFWNQRDNSTGGGAYILAPFAPTGVWTHVIVAFDADETKIWIDGALVTIGPGTSATQPRQGRFVLGGHPYVPNGGELTGEIDDLRIFSRALTDDEVLDLYLEVLDDAINGDVDPPVQSAVSATRQSATSMKTTVSTSESTRYYLEYGLDDNLGGTSWSATPGIAHTRTISPLAPDLRYTLRLWTVDAAGNVAVSSSSVNGTGMASLDLYLKLDETSGSYAADAANSGTSWPIDGTPKWTTGQVGGGLECNGTERVVVGSAFIAGTGYGAYSIWVKPDAGATETHTLMSESVGGNNSSWALRRRHFGNAVVAYQSADGVTSSSAFEVWGSVIPANVWSHVAVSFEPTYTTIYLNGEVVGIGPTGTAMQTSNNTFVIGGSPHPPLTQYFFRGVLDEVKIYDLPLTELQVRSIYLSGI